MELQILNETTSFHTLKKLQYIVSKIPKTKEQPIRCMTSFVVVMEPWEVFINRMMRQPQYPREDVNESSTSKH